MHDNEDHGSKPAWVGATGLRSQVAQVLNSPGRIYWRDRGSNGFGSAHHAIVAGYRGNADALNQLLKTVRGLSLTAPAEVVLLPGNGTVIGQKSRVPCHWRARLTYVNVYLPERRTAGAPEETLTVRVEVFIPELPPLAPAAAAEQINRWIRDLDDDRFAVREKSLQELARQGSNAAPAIRAALAQKPTPEQRRRLEPLLEQAAALRLSDLQIPAGLPAVSFDALLRREKPGLLTAQPAPIWEAANQLHDAVEGTDELLLVLVAGMDEKALAALIEKTKDAPKDYLLSFKPLLDLPADFHANRARYAARLADLRKQLDEFCREAGK
jgi:hypothetical protein